MSQEVRRVISKNIRRIRESKGLTREALSNLIGLDMSYISKLELCKVNSRIDVLAMIAEALEVNIRELFV